MPVSAKPIDTVTDASSTQVKQVQLDPALLPVCSCESTGSPNSIPKQFNSDGSVLRGKTDSRDTGACQINTTYWGTKAKQLGYNLNTKDGNYKMANYIYEHNGLKPWNWSKKCWK